MREDELRLFEAQAEAAVQTAIGQVPSTAEPEVQLFLEQVRSALQGRIMAEAAEAAALNAMMGAGVVRRDEAGAIKPVIPEGQGEAPDLTPPPIPSAPVATAGFSVIQLSWNNGLKPVYAQGHGHDHTNIYVATPDAQGNPPTEASAVLAGTSLGGMFADPARELGKARHYWFSYVTKDGVEGQKAGGINGVAAQAGKVGNADLADLIITADKIAAGTITPGKIDARGLDILDLDGLPMFSHNGSIGANASLNIGGNNVLLSTVASNAMVPSLSFVGEFASAPTAGMLGAAWRQNAVYKNTADGRSYVLTGAPLDWVVYLSDGQSFTLTIESTNGTTFRVGQTQTTTLKARLFKNGAEVTGQTPTGWFRWRRVSAIPRSTPYDDATWNAAYAAGYTQVNLSVDDVYARATFFCDIVSP